MSPSDRVRGNWLPRRDLLAVAVAMLAFVLVVAREVTPREHGDARSYFHLADAIRAGAILESPSRSIPGLANRTPGYPILLATAQAALPDEKSAVYALHLLIGLATLAYVALSLRHVCPAWLGAAIIVFVQWKMRYYFTVAITEWLTFNLVLALFALMERAGAEPSYRRLAALGSLCAFLVLTRPAMAVVAGVPVGFALVQATLPRLRAALVGMVPLALILPWMAVNQVRLGSFTLTPFTGTSLVGIGAIVGNVDPEPDDGSELQSFIEELNALKRPPPGEELDPAWLGQDTFAHVYTWNVWHAAESIRRRHDWDLVTFDRLAMTYGQRSIRAHLGGYARYVGLQMGRSLWAVVPLLPAALFLPVVWLMRGRNRGLALAVGAMLVVHVLQVLFCAMVAVVLPRYEAVTYEPLFGASLVAAAVFLTDLRRDRKGTQAAGSGERRSPPPNARREKGFCLRANPLRALFDGTCRA